MVRDEAPELAAVDREICFGYRMPILRRGSAMVSWGELVAVLIRLILSRHWLGLFRGSAAASYLSGKCPWWQHIAER